MRDKLTVFTKYLLDFMFYIGIVVVVTLPFSLKIYGEYIPFFKEYYISQLIILGVSGIFAVLIIKELRGMFRTVLKDDCFVIENVVSLKRMGTYSFVIAVLNCVRAFLDLTPTVLIVILVFIIAGLFSKVLSRVFDKAVSYKLENDFTI